MPRIWLPLALLMIVSIAMAVFLMPSGQDSRPAVGGLEDQPGSGSTATPKVLEAAPGPEEITRSEAGFEPIADEFAMRAGGLVEVRILDLDGKPAPDRFLVTLEVLHPPPADAERDAKGTWSHHHRHSRGGRAVFPHADFNQKVVARIRSEDGSLSAQLEGFSPADAASKTTLDLEPYLGLYILTGRILNQEGRPGANLLFHFSCESVGFRDSEIPVRTDARGRFRWVVPPFLDPEKEQTIDLGIQRKQSGTRPPRLARREGIVLPGAGIHALGDFTLTPMGLLATGMVVDQVGNPLPEVDLSFYRRDTSFDDMGMDGYGGLLLPGSEDHWTGRSEEDGTFTIRGEVGDGGDFILQAWNMRYRSEDVPVEKGVEDVQLVMHEMLLVVARLELDFGIYPDSLTIRLISHSLIEDGEPFETLGAFDDDGMLRFDGVPAGEAVLLIESPILKEELLRVECEILGEEREPEEVQPTMPEDFLRRHDLGTFDLRGKLFPVDLRIRDAKGNPVESPWVWIEPWETGEYVNPMVVTLVRSEKAIDLLVGAEGYPYRFVGDVRTNLTVTLNKGLDFQVNLDKVPLHSDAWALTGGVFLDRRSDHFWDPFEREEPPSYWGQVVKPGSYRVAFYLYHRQEDGEWDEGNAIAAENHFPLIEIVESEEMQVFEIPWSQENLERAMEWVLEPSSPSVTRPARRPSASATSVR